MGASNQHIEIDGDVLDQEARILRDVTSAFASAAQAMQVALPQNAFGQLAGGLIVPLANGLATQSHELVVAAKNVADRVADGVAQAHHGFDSVEEDACLVFQGGEK